MMQSISHWGQFEMQAAGTENFDDRIYRLAPPPIPKGMPGYIAPGPIVFSDHEWLEDRLPEAESVAAERS